MNCPLFNCVMRSSKRCRDSRRADTLAMMCASLQCVQGIHFFMHFASSGSARFFFWIEIERVPHRHNSLLTTGGLRARVPTAFPAHAPSL
jgi:hypothetical protein